MKKTLLFLVFIAVKQFAFAQFWMEAGIKGGVGSTLLLNSNVLNDAESSYKMKSDFNVGPRLAFNFGDNHGLSLEGLFAQSKAYYASQVGQALVPLNYKWLNIDAYLMYRYYYERSFIEIGPKFSSLSKMELNGTDVKDNFNKQNFGASFGFGGFLAGNESMSLGLNLRFDYQFTDFVSSTGKAANYMNINRTYATYKATTPIVAKIGLDLSFGVGGVARAQCGRRVFFFGGGR